MYAVAITRPYGLNETIYVKSPSPARAKFAVLALIEDPREFVDDGYVSEITPITKSDPMHGSMLHF